MSMYRYHFSQLLEIFQNYTKKYPSLGMTVEEFQKFLLESQYVSIIAHMFALVMYNSVIAS